MIFGYCEQQLEGKVELNKKMVLLVVREKRNINIFKMCGSRKYPYPTPHRRDWIFQGGGGVNLPHFPVGTGGHHREIFPEGSCDA